MLTIYLAAGVRVVAIRTFVSGERLLYTLLDAADDAGVVTGATVTRWREAKTRISCGAPYESEAETLHELLDELATKGALTGSWIEGRWCTLAARVEAKGP